MTLDTEPVRSESTEWPASAIAVVAVGYSLLGMALAAMAAMAVMRRQNGGTNGGANAAAAAEVQPS